MIIFKIGQKGIAHFIIPLVVIVAVGIGGVVAYEASHADASGCVSMTQTPYHTNSCISAIQYMINGFNYYYANKNTNVKPPGYILTVNGYYSPDNGATYKTGASTQNQVERWQEIDNVKGGVDGDTGPYTWAAICTQVNKMTSSWSSNHPGQARPGYMVNAVNAYNNAKCSTIV